MHHQKMRLDRVNAKLLTKSAGRKYARQKNGKAQDLLMNIKYGSKSCSASLGHAIITVSGEPLLFQKAF